MHKNYKILSFVLSISCCVLASCTLEESDYHQCGGSLPENVSVIGRFETDYFNVTTENISSETKEKYNEGMCPNSYMGCFPVGGAGNNYACSPCREAWMLKCQTSKTFECIDVKNDSENCGACGHICNNGYCSNGRCRCTLNAETCAAQDKEFNEKRCECISASECEETKALCLEQGKEYDEDNCECIESVFECSLTAKSCLLEGKDFDAENCECIDGSSECTVTKESCAEQDKDFDEENCECIENAVSECNLSSIYCASLNQSFDKDSCKCVEKSQNTCPNINEIYDSQSKTCICNIDEHWIGMTGNCKCQFGYAEKKDECKELEVGDTFEFGNYPQGNSSINNEVRPIVWRVLDVSEEYILILSEFIIDRKYYNNSDIPVTWEKSTLRSWLNGYGSIYNTDGVDYSENNFIDTAFTEEEQALIDATIVSADETPGYETDPGKATKDKIFLLSMVEANKYFDTDKLRKAGATKFVSNSSSSDTDCKNMYYEYVIGCYSWWLRSPGEGPTTALLIYSSGTTGSYRVNSTSGIRPAFKIKK